MQNIKELVEKVTNVTGDLYHDVSFSPPPVVRFSFHHFPLDPVRLQWRVCIFLQRLTRAAFLAAVLGVVRGAVLRQERPYLSLLGRFQQGSSSGENILFPIFHLDSIKSEIA